MRQALKRQVHSHIVIPSCDFDPTTLLSVYFLRKSRRFDRCRVIRTSDPWLIKHSRVVVNMGGVYDPERFRYDHRAPGFDERFASHAKYRLGTAGLIYRQFRQDIIQNIFRSQGRTISSPAPDRGDPVTTLADTMYGRVVQSFDCVANGIPFCPDATELRFFDHTNIFERLEMYNLASTFEAAVEEVETRFCAILFRIHDSEWPAWPVVREAYQQRLHHGRVMVLNVPCPYQSALAAIERKGLHLREVWFIVQPNSVGGWMVHAVYKSLADRTLRQPLLFAGLDGAELCHESEIKGAIFVHGGGFTAGFETKQGAIDFAGRSARHAEQQLRESTAPK
jgi:uncharacterized UPF0160 family protein